MREKREETKKGGAKDGGTGGREHRDYLHDTGGHSNTDTAHSEKTEENENKGGKWQCHMERNIDRDSS